MSAEIFSNVVDRGSGRDQAASFRASILPASMELSISFPAVPCGLRPKEAPTRRVPSRRAVPPQPGAYIKYSTHQGRVRSAAAVTYRTVIHW